MIRPMKTTRKGFTLIELLVVIAIIAILAAILFPVFAQAREKARQTTCLSNMKQIGLGVMMYVQDYDEAYPRIRYRVTPPPRASWASFTWQDAIAPYIKNGAITVTWASADGNTPVTLWGGAVWNCPTQPDSNARTVYGGHNFVFTKEANDQDGSIAFPPTTLASIGRSADIAMISENGVVHQWDGIGDPEMTSDPYWQCGTVWVCEGPESGARFDADVPPGQEGNAWPYNAMPRYRHNGVANFAFADGHAKSINKGRLNWCRNIYFPGVRSTWDGGDPSWLFGAGNACANFPRD